MDKEKDALIAKIQTLASIMVNITDLEELQAYLYEAEAQIYDYLDEKERPKLKLVK